MSKRKNVRPRDDAEPQAHASELPEGAESVRLTDVLTFLEIFHKAENGTPKERANFSTLLSKEVDLDHPKYKPGLTTRISQLERIVDFLYGKGAADRTGLHRLFEKHADGGLTPSADARSLYKQFEILKSVYFDIKPSVEADRARRQPLVLRVGSPQTIGMRILSAMLSDRRRLLPPEVRLVPEIGNSVDLIRRLKAGLLDVVLAYGHEKDSGIIDPQTGLTFRSLGYDSRMVLLCPPTEPLWIKAVGGKGQDMNDGYWEKGFRVKRMQDLPAFDSLRSIALKDIDFSFNDNLPLIFVDSWKQPESLETFVRTLSKDRVIRIPLYEEALALVRMGEGYAVTSEIFSKRRKITAFRLEPAEHFVRWIGAYFRPPENLLPDHVRRFIQICELYFKRCKDQIRQGTPPSFGSHEDVYNKFICECNKL